MEVIMSELIHIGNTEISVKEYKGQRVVTFKDIDAVHGRPDGTARRNFNTNKKRFKEGEDFFLVGSDEIRTSCIFPISDNDYMDKVLVTEQGYLMLVKSFTDDLAWEVQRQLVNGYFRVRQLVDERLSPQLQALEILLNQMKQKEIDDLQRDKKIEELKTTTENIKEAVKPVFDNWREEVNRKFNRIQRNADKPFNTLRVEMYSELEHRAGCDLGARLRNKKQRMAESGCTKKEVNDCNRMDIIEEDKKLREIFSKIVSEYEIKYCA